MSAERGLSALQELMAEFSRCADRVLSASDTTPVETKDLRASAGKILQLASSIRKSLTNVEAQSSRGAAARDGSIRSEVARLEKELERKRALKAQFEADVARWQKRFEALCQKNRAVSKQVLPVDSGLPLGGSPKPPGARRGRAPSPAQRL